MTFFSDNLKLQQQDLTQGVHDLASGARGAAVLVEQGGGAGLDILSQFGQLFGKLLMD